MTKAPVEIRSLARAHTESAIRTIAHVMANEDAPASARVAAAEALLDRGWGRPKQTLAADPEGGPLIVEIIQRVREPRDEK